MAQKPKPKKPETPLEFSIYRAKLNCGCVPDIIKGTTQPPPGVSKTEYSLVFIAAAISELAAAIEILAKKTP